LKINEYDTHKIQDEWLKWRKALDYLGPQNSY